MVEVEVVIFEVIERKVMIGVGELELKRGFFIFFFYLKLCMRFLFCMVFK
ncbi:hypothetical protein GCM10010095_85160 [Streptomyces anthocyanicus]|nr:hypothetical protein GCM10010095_85160 [Streptomyces anthocyanicus]